MFQNSALQNAAVFLPRRCRRVISEDRCYVSTFSEGSKCSCVRISVQCTLFFPQVQRGPDKTCFWVPSSQKVFDTFLYGWPNIFKKISIGGQLVVLSDAPQDCGALVLLLTPRGRGSPFNVVSLVPSPVGFLSFFAPTIEGFCVFVIAAAV